MGIGIGVILGQAERPGPGERRFVHTILEDARFTLTCLAAAPPPADVFPAGVARALALEARAFPAPDTAPSDLPLARPLPGTLPEGTDVLVDFSHSEAALALGAGAGEGLWRLSAYEPSAGLAEARDRAPFTPVCLTRHRAGAAPERLATARYDTKFLATRNAAVIREKSVQLALQALARLATTGSSDGCAEPAAASRAFAPRDLPGYGLRTARALALRGLNAASERAGMRPGMFDLRLGHGNGLEFDPSQSVALEPPAGTYWADPFLLDHDGGLYLFYEVYDYKTRLGHVDVGRIEGDRLVPLGTALKRPTHLSFPFVFPWNGDVWMIPETHAAKRLELWRAVDFPLRWELVTTAFEGVSLADTVVFERDGQWWLFTNICRDSFNDHGTELHVFRIDSPALNRIEPHPLNPVVIDTTTARGGGRVFEHDGKLYRTSQDNSHGLYGFGLNLMEITRLDETGYAERRVRHVIGDFEDGIMACHHMDAAAGRVVIDVRRRMLGAPKPKG
jgi:hypothetical protein